MVSERKLQKDLEKLANARNSMRSEELERILKRHGYVETPQGKGSHKVLKYPGMPGWTKITIPKKMRPVYVRRAREKLVAAIQMRGDSSC